MQVSIGPSEVKISPRTRAARHPDSKSVYAQRIAPSDFQIAPCALDWCCMDSKSVYAENAPCHAAPEGGRSERPYLWGVTALRVENKLEYQCLYIIGKQTCEITEECNACDGAEIPTKTDAF